MPNQSSENNLVQGAEPRTASLDKNNVRGTASVYLREQPLCLTREFSA